MCLPFIDAFRMAAAVLALSLYIGSVAFFLLFSGLITSAIFNFFDERKSK